MVQYIDCILFQWLNSHFQWNRRKSIFSEKLSNCTSHQQIIGFVHITDRVCWWHFYQGSDVNKGVLFVQVSANNACQNSYSLEETTTLYIGGTDGFVLVVI